MQSSNVQTIIIVFLVLIIIVIIGAGFAIVRNKDSRSLTRVLTLRVTLCAVLVGLLLLGIATGYVKPHGPVDPPLAVQEMRAAEEAKRREADTKKGAE